LPSIRNSGHEILDITVKSGVARVELKKVEHIRMQAVASYEYDAGAIGRTNIGSSLVSSVMMLKS